MEWMQLFFMVLAGLLAWLGYRHYKSSPEAYSLHNLSKSFNTLGVLALLLLLFIWLLVVMLRQ